MRPTRRWSAFLPTALAAMLLAACATSGDQATRPEPSGADQPSSAPSESQSAHGHHGQSAKPARTVPLRDGERRMTVRMPSAYTPSAPYGTGTDDYRCFLLDPALDDDVFVTGTDVLPGNPEVVHHVILFEVPSEQVATAQELDDADTGQGWTCFGGTGIGAGAELDDAPWLGGWAPGGGESVLHPGYGRPMEVGSRIVMQVHYNLLADVKPDVSATRLRVTDGSAGLEPVSTMLLPAPVELPCRGVYSSRKLCARDASLADVKKRFGEGPGSIADMLHLLCPGNEPGPVQSCTRPITEAATIIGAAGHMHLLGRSIRVEINPGTASSRTVLDIPVWDFDNQGARPIEPVEVQPGDKVRVTCEHDQQLRDLLPAFEGQPDRYVLWGEGTTDEMCLGILQVA